MSCSDMLFPVLNFIFLFPAQSAFFMKGFLIGVLFAVRGIFQLPIKFTGSLFLILAIWSKGYMHAELILASYMQQTVALHFLAMIGLVNLISSCCQAIPRKRWWTS